MVEGIIPVYAEATVHARHTMHSRGTMKANAFEAIWHHSINLDFHQ